MPTIDNNTVQGNKVKYMALTKTIVMLNLTELGSRKSDGEDHKLLGQG